MVRRVPRSGIPNTRFGGVRSASSFAQEVYVVAFGGLHAKDCVIDKIRIAHFLELCPSRLQFPLGCLRKVEQFHVLLSGRSRMAGSQFPDRSPMHFASPGAIFAQRRRGKTRAACLGSGSGHRMSAYHLGGKCRVPYTMDVFAAPAEPGRYPDGSPRQGTMIGLDVNACDAATQTLRPALLLELDKAGTTGTFGPWQKDSGS